MNKIDDRNSLTNITLALIQVLKEVNQLGGGLVPQDAFIIQENAMRDFSVFEQQLSDYLKQLEPDEEYTLEKKIEIVNFFEFIYSELEAIIEDFYEFLRIFIQKYFISEDEND